MPEENHSSFVKCGKVFEPEIPFELNLSEPPIVLAEVRINPGDFERPCVFLKFSEFIAFSLLGLNPQLSILYRLVREDGTIHYPQILEEWAFEVEAAEIREVGDLVTSQPTVLSFCDCFGHHKKETVTYRLEIAQIVTNNVRTLDITNKSFIATLLNQAPEQRSSCSKEMT